MKKLKKALALTIMSAMVLTSGFALSVSADNVNLDYCFSSGKKYDYFASGANTIGKKRSYSKISGYTGMFDYTLTASFKARLGGGVLDNYTLSRHFSNAPNNIQYSKYYDNGIVGTADYAIKDSAVVAVAWYKRGQ